MIVIFIIFKKYYLFFIFSRFLNCLILLLL